MSAQLVSRNQIQTTVPLEVAREVVWRVFQDQRIGSPVIDTAQNRVVGTVGDGVISVSYLVVAQFEAGPNGTLITFDYSSQLPGTIDFGSSKKKASQLAAAARERLAQSQDVAAVGPAPAATDVSAPIAAPTGERALPMGRPVYGVAPAARLGVTLLLYGLLSLCCCQIAAPFTIYYGFVALKKYRQHDPGDKGLVIAGMVLGALGIVALLFNILRLVARAPITG